MQALTLSSSEPGSSLLETRLRSSGVGSRVLVVNSCILRIYNLESYRDEPS
jgi:hypothetical protein